MLPKSSTVLTVFLLPQSLLSTNSDSDSFLPQALKIFSIGPTRIPSVACPFWADLHSMSEPQSHHQSASTDPYNVFHLFGSSLAAATVQLVILMEPCLKNASLRNVIQKSGFYFTSLPVNPRRRKQCRNDRLVHSKKHQ